MMPKKRLFIQTLTALVLAALIALPVRAEGGVTITLTPDRSELTVGDPVILTLEVRHPAGYRVIIPQLPQTWGNFEVRSQSQVETGQNEGGSETTRQTIAVTLFAPGEFQTPPLPVTISDEAGQISEETVAPLALTVTPVLPAEENDLFDIRPQAMMAVPPLWPWIVAGFLPLAVLAWAARRWYRRWQNKRGPLPAPVVDNRPPYQVAYDELDYIEGLHLPDQGRFKEHYTLLIDCLRRYLEEQFQVRAFDRTTSELKLTLRQSSVSPPHARRFIALFAESDWVKFAGVIPDLQTARQIVQLARQLVDETKATPDVETTGTGHPPEPLEVPV